MVSYKGAKEVAPNSTEVKKFWGSSRHRSYGFLDRQRHEKRMAIPSLLPGPDLTGGWLLPARSGWAAERVVKSRMRVMLVCKPCITHWSRCFALLASLENVQAFSSLSMSPGERGGGRP